MIFFSNRLLRILPLYLFVCLISYLSLIYFSQSTAHILKTIPVNGTRYITEEHLLFGDYWAGVRPDPVIIKFWPLPQFVAFFGWVPQFWTISIEFVFYALIPVLLLARKNFGAKTTPFYLIVTFLCYIFYSTTPEKGDFGLWADVVYRNAIPSMFFFMFGMALYELQLVYKSRIPAGWALTSTLLIILLILAGSKYLESKIPLVYSMMYYQMLVALSTIPVIFSTGFRNNIMKKLDNICGNLSYGVYLNHFVMLGLYYWYRVSFNKINYQDTAPLFYYVLISVSTIALSYLTFILVENPINTFKNKLKSQFKIVDLPR